MRGRRIASGVTLVAVSSVALDATVSALSHSLGQIGFDHALLLSDECPPGLAGSGIEWRRIERLDSRADYSRFMLHHLADHIETDHTLVVQWDGFVRDGSRWRDEFLDYDYIGAVWPQFSDNCRVGNGGFSLRSRRLIEAARDVPLGSEPEDVLLCRTHRHMLETKHNVRFAGLEIARQFSYEREISTGNEFGFHGSYNLLAELPRKARAQWIASLEPGVLGRHESVELMLQTLARGEMALAWQTLKHVSAHAQVARRVIHGARRALVSHLRRNGALPVGEQKNER